MTYGAEDLAHAGELRMRRIRQGLTQERLAQLAGADVRKIQHVEDTNDDHDPDLLQRIAHALNTHAK